MRRELVNILPKKTIYLATLAGPIDPIAPSKLPIINGISNNLTWLLLLLQQQQDDKQQEKRRTTTTTRKKSTNEKEQKKPIQGCSSSLESDSETSDDALNGGVEAKPGLFFSLHTSTNCIYSY